MNKNFKEYTDRYTDFSKKSISDFILYNSGIEHCEPGYSYGPKKRDYHFIHFVTEGKGRLEINNQVIDVHENQLFIVPANITSTYTADKHTPWKYAWIGFTGIESGNFVQSLIQSATNEFVLDCPDSSFFEKEINKILDLNQNNRSAYFKINGIMYTIIGTILEKCQRTNNLTHHISSATQAVRYMELHYHDDIQIADIANAVGLHPNYFSLLFKEELGLSPKKYLMELKINKAKKMLLENDDPINLIASFVGFSDALSFSKFFKKEVGISPTEYRKENFNL